jgi:hypothetical protein
MATMMRAMVPPLLCLILFLSTTRFNLSVEKKYRRPPINGFIGCIGKFLGQK